MKTITSKFMEEKLTEGWTIEQFAENLQISEDAFFKLLEKTFNRPYVEGIKRRLNKNNKQAKRSKTKVTSDSASSENPTTSVNDKKVEISKEDKDTHLQNLKNRASVLKNLIERNNKLLSGALSYKANIEKKLEEGRIKYEEFVLENQRKLNNASLREKDCITNISKQTSELESILSEIRKLSLISILIYEDGNFSIDEENIEIPKDWQLICFDIMVNKDFENLSIAQMNAVAKIFKLTNDCKDLNFEIIFDSEEMQKCFEWIKKEKEQ